MLVKEKYMPKLNFPYEYAREKITDCDNILNYNKSKN